MRRATRPAHSSHPHRAAPPARSAAPAVPPSPPIARSRPGRGRASFALLLTLALALALGLSFASGPGRTALASGQTAQGGLTTLAVQEGFELRISVANCQIAPPQPPTLNDAGCAPAVGAAVSVVDDSGAEIGACIANDIVPSGQAATCIVITPFDITGQVSLDPTTIAAGFAPQTNPLPFTAPRPGASDGIVSTPIFVNLPTGGVVTQPEPTQAAAQTDPIQPQTSGPDHAATVSSGTCAAIATPAPAPAPDPAAATVPQADPAAVNVPQGDPIAVNAPEGDPIGLPTALIAEAGGGVIPIALNDLFTTPHAIVVATPGEGQGTNVACGDLGTVADDDGVAVIGLAPLGGSGLAGIAYLTTDPANPTQTLVSIFLSQGLSG